MAITPENGQEETIRIVALDQSFHVNCYKCEVCNFICVTVFYKGFKNILFF